MERRLGERLRESLLHCTLLAVRGERRAKVAGESGDLPWGWSEAIRLHDLCPCLPFCESLLRLLGGTFWLHQVHSGLYIRRNWIPWQQSRWSLVI